MSDRSMLAGAGSFFWELVKVFLLAIVIIVPIRYFLIQPFFVRGASMEPTYFNEEYLVIDELSYRLRAPARGEVIVFRYPIDPSEYFIKRIVGLPGEKVEVKNGSIFISNKEHPDGVQLDESAYLPSEVRTGKPGVTTLGADQYFVLGDNRSASSDSREWGILPKSDIIGRVWLRAFPVNRLTVFSYPSPGFLNP